MNKGTFTRGVISNGEYRSFIQILVAVLQTRGTTVVETSAFESGVSQDLTSIER